MRVRLTVYALIGCLASAVQFRFYDCSGVAALSFATGTLTIIAALVMIDRLYWVASSGRSLAQRWAVGAAVCIVGTGAIVVLAWLTRLTHLCG